MNGALSAPRRRRGAPVPLRLLFWPLRWWWRSRRKVREQAKQEARIQQLVHARTAHLDGDLPAPVVPPTVRERFKGWRFRHRRALRPIYLMPGLVVVWAPPHAVGGWWWLLPLAVPALGVWWVGKVHDQRIQLTGERWWLRVVGPFLGRRAVTSSTVAAGTLWVVLPVGGADVPWRWWLLLTGMAVAVAVRAWHYRVRPVPVVVPERGPVEVWAETLGARGPLAGTCLTGLKPVLTPQGEDVGWTATVECAVGEHNTSKVRAQTEDIGGAFGRDLPDVTVERTGNALRPLLAVMLKDPFEQERVWEGPSLTDDGIFRIGTFYDGKPAYERLWTPGAGTHDFWAFGVKGSGKSTKVDCALGSVMSKGIVCLALTDMKGGVSLPQWAEIAEMYGTTAADGLMMLRKLDAIGKARLAAMSEMRWHAPGDPKERVGVTCLEPSVQWPAWLGLIEEAPQLWQIQEAREIGERIITLYRAVLVAFMAISQMCEQRQAWGNSSTLREQIQGSNVWAGYVGSNQARLGFDHFDPDLSKLEKGSYRSYVTSPVESREAILRVDRIQDSWAVARRSIPGTPNPVDLDAIAEVEARYAPKLASVSPISAEPANLREIVEEAVSALAARSTDGAVAAGRVIEHVGERLQIDPDGEEWGRHAGRVRKHLESLKNDGGSTVHSPKWGVYAA